MNKFLRLACGFVLWLPLCMNSGFAQKSKARVLQKKMEKITEKAEWLRTKMEVPGIGLGIVKDGEVLMARGFGFRNVEDQLQVDHQTLFAIGSASKAFATASMAQLVHQGILDWDEKVRHYLPDFELMDPVATQEMTLLDMMIHRSGLPRHDFSWIGSPFDRKGLYDRLKYLESNTSFRGAWQYQNLMYTTGGYLVGQVAGQSWESFVQTRLFDPLDMTSSNLSLNDMLKVDNITQPYTIKDSVVTKVGHGSYDAIAPAGGVNSNVEDMLKWVQLQLKDSARIAATALSAGQIDYMHGAHTVVSTRRSYKEISHKSYGLGWFVYYNQGHLVVEHGGNVTGYSALVYLLPDDDTGLVILTNMNATGLPAVLALYATDILLDNPEVNWYERLYGKPDDKKDTEEDEPEEAKRIADTQPQHELTDYVGAYEHPGYGSMTISLDNDDLVAEYNSRTYPLEHWHFDTFRGTDDFYEIKRFFNFRTSQDGEVNDVEVAFEASVEAIRFKKLPPNNMEERDFLEKLVGEYLVENVQKAKVEFKAENTIQLVISGQPAYELTPYRENEFSLKPLKGYSIKFNFNEDGEVSEAIFYQPNGTFKAVRQ